MGRYFVFRLQVCVAAVVVLALVMVILKGFDGPWWNYLIRYILLFSYIVPISLRVNLDIGKICYAYMIQADSRIPQTVVRSSTIPEELGRINYLLSDKTGTLTKNEMIFKRLHVGDQVRFPQAVPKRRISIKKHPLTLPLKYFQSILCTL